MRKSKKKSKETKFAGFMPLPEWVAIKNEKRAIEIGERIERIAKSLENLVALFGGSIS